VQHLVICRRPDGGWINLEWVAGEAHVIEARRAPSILGPVERLLGDMQRCPGANISFTSRTSEELVGEPLLEDPSSLAAAVPGGSMTILLPERDTGGVWTMLWRDTQGTIHAGGREARFQPATLADQVNAFFKREDPKSFEPLGTLDQKPNALPANRPACARELWVRPLFVAAELLPEAFPPPPPSFHLSAQQKAERDERERRGRAWSDRLRTKDVPLFGHAPRSAE